MHIIVKRDNMYSNKVKNSNYLDILSPTYDIHNLSNIK